VVHGDLIDTLQFTIGSATMGQTFEATDGTVVINIRLRVPPTNNNIYGPNVPILHHFDIIQGEIRTRAAAPTIMPYDGVTGYSEDYKKDTVHTTKVIARFGASAAAACPQNTNCAGVVTTP